MVLNMTLLSLTFHTVKESSCSSYLSELRSLLEKEWGCFGEFEEQRMGLSTPPAIIAVEDGCLVGGLVFSLWQNPEESGLAVWINGVIVKEQYRRQGIASELIQYAMLAQSPLYVLSHIDDLYRKVGWHVHSYDTDGTVLKYKKDEHTLLCNH